MVSVTFVVSFIDALSVLSIMMGWLTLLMRLTVVCIFFSGGIPMTSMLVTLSLVLLWCMDLLRVIGMLMWCWILVTLLISVYGRLMHLRLQVCRWSRVCMVVLML